MFFQQFLVRVRKLFPDHDTGHRGPGQVPGDDNETRVLHHWVPRHNYRPQIISSSHTSQNNQPLNTINNPDQQTTVNLCLSRTTQSYRVASAFIQFERKLFPFLFIPNFAQLHNYTGLNFPLGGNYNTGQFSPLRIHSRVSRIESEVKGFAAGDELQQFNNFRSGYTGI